MLTLRKEGHPGRAARQGLLMRSGQGEQGTQCGASGFKKHQLLPCRGCCVQPVTGSRVRVEPSAHSHRDWARREHVPLISKGLELLSEALQDH